MTPEGLTALADVERPSNPFPGLRPFEFGESHLYFGRDGQSDQLIRKLAATRFVAVVGTSGSGKSSLVRAGLLPDLFSGFMTGAGSHWRVALMRPGNDPLGNLAGALCSTEVFGSDDAENAALQTVITEATLRRGGPGLVEAVRQNRMAPNERLLVVVDQFEELFRFARVAASEQYRYEAAAFVKLLLEAARQREQNVYVVLTMRSDFLGDCSIFWDLPEAINEGQYLIPRMTRDQRAEATTGPVAVCGGRMEQRLVNRLLNDTGDNPDLLPILQHALMRTWENWAADHAEGEAVDLRHYEAVGTMADALSRHADEAFNELTNERSREIAERVFKALTEKGEDNREVRRPTVLRDLCALVGAGLSEVVPVVEVFRREGRSFLMPPASVPLEEESLIDISHESLIRNWARLKGWVDEESQSAQIYTRLAETAVLHERGHAGLWRDPDLQLALDWRERTKPTAAWAARYHPSFDASMTFLDASVRARDDAALEEERRRRREIRRTRVAALIFFLLFMLSLAALTYANVKRNEAQEKGDAAVAALARAEQANARAEAALAEAVRERDRANEQTDIAKRNEDEAQVAKVAALNEKKAAEEAKADAVESAEVARRNELAAVAAKSAAKTAEGNALAAAEYSSRLLYASDMNLAQQAYDTSAVARARELLEAHSARAGDSPGFDWYYLWNQLHSDAKTVYPYEPGGPKDPGYNAALAGDGRTLAVNKYGRVELWDVLAGTKTREVKVAEEDGRDSLAVSPDARLLAYGDPSSPVVKLIDVATAGEVVLKGQTRGASAVTFSPDGATLAVGRALSRAGGNPHLELWDVKARELRAELEHEGSVYRIAFSPDGRVVAAGNPGGMVRVWDAKSKSTLCELAGKEGGVNALVFSPDGQMLAAGDFKGNIRVVAMSNCAQERYTLAGPSAVNALVFSPDGARLVVAFDDQSLRSLDIASQEFVTLDRDVKSIDYLAYAADGSLLAYYMTGPVKLLDAETRVREQWLKKTNVALRNVAFSPDGSALAAGGDNRAVLFWDAATKELKKELYLLDFGKEGDVGFKWAGHLVATIAAGEGRIRLWDARTFAELPPIEVGDVNVNAIALSQDGRTLVEADVDKSGEHSVVRAWDVASKKLLGSVELNSPGNIYSLAVSPDGSRMAACLSDSGVRVWDGSLARELTTLPTPPDAEEGEDARARGLGSTASSLTFSPDGRLLAVGTANGYLQVWDVGARVELAVSYAHEGTVRSVAFSPDGATLATGGDDRTVRLWSASSFKQLLTLTGHRSDVMAVAFSPDGRTLVSTDGMGTVRLWRAASEAEVNARARASGPSK